jgi:hypothetical protein
MNVGVDDYVLLGVSVMPDKTGACSRSSRFDESSASIYFSAALRLIAEAQ